MSARDQDKQSLLHPTAPSAAHREGQGPGVHMARHTQHWVANRLGSAQTQGEPRTAGNLSLSPSVPLAAEGTAARKTEQEGALVPLGEGPTKTRDTA